MPTLFSPILAEVADKMNSWPTEVAWMLGISLASVVGLRRRSWFAVIPGLFAVLWAWGAYDILADRFMRPAVIAELGLSYILIQFMPLIVFVVFFVPAMKKRPNQALQPTPGSVTPRASSGNSK